MIYYGANPQFTCTQCVAVATSRGAKWALVHRFLRSREYAAVAPRYRAVMIADDDLLMRAVDVSRAFAVFRGLDLRLGQPALCSAQNSETAWPIVYRRGGMLAHYTDFVEIMAPMFDAATLAGMVVDTLTDAHTGWGLDFVWPFLLGYPDKGVAVIDVACMHHPYTKTRGSPSLYDVELPRPRCGG